MAMDAPAVLTETKFESRHGFFIVKMRGGIVWTVTGVSVPAEPVIMIP